MLSELGDRTLPPRDLDIIAIEDFKPDTSNIPQLSAQLMPEDYQHGHGIKVERLGEYFDQRDFTINEILVSGNEIYVTEQALRDLKNKVIRPTKFESGQWNGDYEDMEGLHPKLVMKALRLQVEFDELYDEGKIEGIEDWQWQIDNVPLFYLGLALEKAYQRGDALATKFYVSLLRQGTIEPTSILAVGGKSTKELALSIRYNMHEEGRDPFTFSRDQLNGEQAEEKDYKYEKYAEKANTYLRRAGLSRQDEY